MYSVTGRINIVKQPHGGYLRPSSMDCRTLDDGQTLSEKENIHSTVMGMAVDYLTRFAMGTPVEEAFRISLIGADIASEMIGKKAKIEAKKYCRGIKGLDDKSVINACKLVTFDVWKRNTLGALMAKTAADTNPDADTVKNIQIMVNRSLQFWKEYGPITEDGFTFEPYGYSPIVSSGDGDYLTADTMWDFKVSKSKPNSRNTLQLLMYWIMGQHSGKPEFKGLKKIGIFNPRLNMVFTYDMSKFPKERIEEIENEVICYY